ncbi:MAG TPA: FAD-dependent oxidoreductase [Myxococcota bacterium]|nr:FAD-dependent oxidoreductase [Myxococcota bacterium]
MKIAIVGSGISGLVSAWSLARRHEIVLFEADRRLGGHTHTVAIDLDGRRFDVDTGFIVFNERTYPNFQRILSELDVPSRPTVMSFSYRCERTGREYSGSGLDGFFAQRRNLLRPRHLSMLRDILRFQREAPDLLEIDGPEITLGDYLDTRGYSPAFLDEHLLPMGGAIWSSTRGQLRDFPAQAFVRFFANHGLLQLRDRPRWRTIPGGSRRYVDAMLRRLSGKVRVGCAIQRIRRRPDGVWLDSSTGPQGPFDRVLVATHSDQALRMLESPSEDERRVLGAIRYQPNEAVLHTDASLLPRTRRARAAWNYHGLPGPEAQPAVTYWMNALQSIEAPVEICVTLNRSEAIDPRRILRRIQYSHPVFDGRALEAQRHRSRISGRDRVHFCGAYWRHGFHEDGVLSALWAIDEIERAEEVARTTRLAG